MDYKIVSDFPEEVIERWEDIARELGLSEQTIDEINIAYEGNAEFCCEQAIKECLIRREVKMNWQSLIEALRKLHVDELIDFIHRTGVSLIYTKFNSFIEQLYVLFAGHHVRIQKKLLNDELTFSGVSEACMEQLAVLVEPHWKHLSPYINPSTSPGPVVDQLKRWREKMRPTFGDLSEILSHLYIQPPPLSAVESNVKGHRSSLSSKDQDGTFALA